jgi:hypothetical protein
MWKSPWTSALAAVLVALGLVGAACDDDGGEPDAACIQCCYCRCTDSTIPIDTNDPADCIDCVDRCVSAVCSQYGGGGGEASEPCDEADGG